MDKNPPKYFVLNKSEMAVGAGSRGQQADDSQMKKIRNDTLRAGGKLKAWIKRITARTQKKAVS